MGGRGKSRRGEEKVGVGEGGREEEEGKVDTHTKRFLRGSSGGRVRCGRTNICNRGWFFIEVFSSGRLSLHV